MSAIDWSKAPDGCTHCNMTLPSAWLKEHPKSFYTDSEWIEYNCIVTAEEHFAGAIPRPSDNCIVNTTEHDEVNNPKHYDLFPNQQVIDVIQSALTPEEFAGYCKGNALKYRLRAGDKGDAIKCIAKANWYQNKLREVKK